MQAQLQKCAMVTGGNRGIGAGIAAVLAKNGYDVAITYRGAAEEAESVKAEIEQLGQRCFVIQASLEQEGEAESAVKKAIHCLGRLDLLVNNAGLTIATPLPAMADEDFSTLVNLNFKAYVMAARTAVRHMIKHQIPGSVVFITSTRGGRAYEADGIYGGLKAAISRAAQSFALDVAPYGIRINCVAPGATRIRFTQHEFLTEFYDKLSQRIPLGRVGLPADIGEAVCFLADNEKAGYITGITLNVDGGLVLPGLPEDPQAPVWKSPPLEKTWDDSDL